MGQLVDLHTQVQALLVLIQTAAGGPTRLRVYDGPPVQAPEMPCVFALTPDEDFQRNDTMTGESSVVVVIRLCVQNTKPQTTLLELADTIVQTTDVWAWNDPPGPIDRARRTGMRGVTPVFNDVPARGADFPLSIQMVRSIQPAP